jgi:hypothetical protein
MGAAWVQHSACFLAFGIGAERNMGFEGWGENWDWETYNTNHKKLSSRHTIRKN